jgi:hypothetical protein
MREELRHALMDGLCELELLPRSHDGALLGVYAVMDDLRAAMARTQALDPCRGRSGGSMVGREVTVHAVSGGAIRAGMSPETG